FPGLVELFIAEGAAVKLVDDQIGIALICRLVPFRRFQAGVGFLLRNDEERIAVAISFPMWIGRVCRRGKFPEGHGLSPFSHASAGRRLVTTQGGVAVADAVRASSVS